MTDNRPDHCPKSCPCPILLDIATSIAHQEDALACILNAECAKINKTVDSYDNYEILENDYGISLRALVAFANKTYHANDSITPLIKAINVLLFKLEGQIIMRHPEFDMADRLLLDKPMWNSRLGCETVDKMIFDTYRKTMYLVAAGRPHQLTVDDVRKAAMITSMLALHEHSSERYLPMVALYVISKDWDRFIDTYIRRIFPMAEDSYKGILLGFLTQYYPQFSPIQKGVIDKALRRIAQNRDYDKRTTEAFITNLHK